VAPLLEKDGSKAIAALGNMVASAGEPDAGTQKFYRRDGIGYRVLRIPRNTSKPCNDTRVITMSFDLNEVVDRWLPGNAASSVFGIASVFALPTSAVWYYLNEIPVPRSEFGNLAFGVGFVIGLLSILLIWLGMWRFWKIYDRSARQVKRITFAVLLFGVWFGAIAYYLFVYRRRREIDALGVTLVKRES
jgi:hypothetical protein